MLIWFDKSTKRVVAHNSYLTDAELESYHKKSPNTTMFVNGLPEKSEGMEHPVLYVNAETKELKWVDEPIETVEPEPSQLDRIEAEIMKSNDELRQEGADALTEELIAMGII